MDLHRHNKQKESVVHQGNYEQLEDCNDQDIKTDWFFPMPQ